MFKSIRRMYHFYKIYNILKKYKGVIIHDLITSRIHMVIMYLDWLDNKVTFVTSKTRRHLENKRTLSYMKPDYNNTMIYAFERFIIKNIEAKYNHDLLTLKDLEYIMEYISNNDIRKLVNGLDYEDDVVIRSSVIAMMENKM